MSDNISKKDLDGIKAEIEDIIIQKSPRKKEFYLTLSLVFRKQKNGAGIIAKANEIQGIFRKHISNNDRNNIYFYPETDLHISLVNFIIGRYDFTITSNEDIEEFKQNLLTDRRIQSFQQEIFDYFNNIYFDKRWLGSQNLTTYYDFLFCGGTVALQVFIPSDLARLCKNITQKFSEQFEPVIDSKLYPKNIELPRRGALNLIKFLKIPQDQKEWIKETAQFNKRSLDKFDNKMKLDSFEIDRLSLVVSDDILSNQSPEIMPIYLQKKIGDASKLSEFNDKQ